MLNSLACNHVQHDNALFGILIILSSRSATNVDSGSRYRGMLELFACMRVQNDSICFARHLRLGWHAEFYVTRLSLSFCSNESYVDVNIMRIIR